MRYNMNEAKNRNMPGKWMTGNIKIGSGNWTDDSKPVKKITFATQNHESCKKDRFLSLYNIITAILTQQPWWMRPKAMKHIGWKEVKCW